MNQIALDKVNPCWCEWNKGTNYGDQDEFDEGCAQDYMLINLGKESFTWDEMVKSFCEFKGHPRYFYKGIHHTSDGHSIMGEDCKECSWCEECLRFRKLWSKV